MDASTLEVCEREHLIEEHIPRPQSVLRMDLSHYWISRVVALGAGFTCALLLAQALGPKVARGKTEGGGGQFLQEWKFEEVNVNSGDKVFDVLFNQTLYDCIEPVKHIADKRGRCYDTIFARQHKCYALRKEEPPASCKRTVKCLQGKKDEKPINPCEWLCTGGNRNQAWVKERCDKAAHDAMRWSGKCLDHGYEQRSFEAMEDVNVLSQRCVDETTSTTTQVGSHFFCWALVVPWTNEVDLLLMQQKLKKGIFECDGHEIYSDRSQRIYETIDKRSKKAQEMIARAAVEEVKNLTKDMQDVFEVQDIKGQIFKSLGEIDTPSLATIIASAFAPAQLRALHISNAISLMTVLVVVIIDALILVSDRGFTCQSFVGNKEGKRDAVDLWYKVDLGIAAFCVLVRLWTVRTLSPLIQEMNNPPMLEMQDDPVQALRALLAYYLNTGSRAIMRVDEITESLIYALSNWTVLFNLIWIGVAGDLVLNTPWSSCHDPGLIILRIRFILFLILIVPVLLNVVLFFAGRMLNGEGLQISLLNSASKADESLGIGVPLCSILVQAFFIRNKRDMINIQLKILQMKKEEAEKKRLEAEKELQRLQGDETSQDSQVETLQHQLQEEAGKDDNQVVKEQEEQREKVLQEAEQVFGLLNERAKKASGEAEAQVKKWEEGDGGELLQAISKGEGGAKLQEMLGKVDMQSMASQYAQQAQQMAGDLQNQEWVKDASQRAQAAVADAQQRGQELYNSEEVQGLMQGDQLQAAMQAGQEAASSAASAAQDAMSK